jgi:exopolyphosphatase/guanosine-5'-triphosphate,3'-diphosphate pyrophosphatase
MIGLLPQHQSPIKRIAAIDLGTNSFHVVVVEIMSDGSFRRVDDLKEMVVLAKEGIGKNLSEEAIERGLAALKNIRILCDSYEVDEILAYATSAIREAENGGVFIQRSIDEIGIKIRAIPGSMEAELIGYAVQHGMSLDQDPVLMVDIGGGSVEFILGNVHEFHYLSSYKIGVSRMTDRFKPSDPISQAEIEQISDYYLQALAPIAHALQTWPTQTIIGSSGTMQNIALMIAASKGMDIETMPLNEWSFSASDFEHFYNHFIGLNRRERMHVPGLDEKRIDFINTGMILVHVLCKEFGMNEVRISTQALREGMIIRYLKKEFIGLPGGAAPDPRRRSVFELLRKCNWHEQHSRQVTRLSLLLFDYLAEALTLNEEDRELLEYAALMHDIGYHISHSKHHKHALYLILNADLKGFREDEIAIMAHVARYHRRSTPKKRHEEFAMLNKSIRKRIQALSGILRVADGLDRSHFQNVQELSVELSKKECQISIKTIDEPNLEIWGAMRKSHLLSQTLGREVHIRALNA